MRDEQCGLVCLVISSVEACILVGHFYCLYSPRTKRSNCRYLEYTVLLCDKACYSSDR